MALPYVVTCCQPFPATPNRLRQSALHPHYWCELPTGIAYRTWAPAQSRVRIEYSTRVLGQLRRESARGNTGGVLFGVQRGNDLQVLAARYREDDADLRLAGFTPVGIFAARVRGEVFLTESDLERFITVDGPVALVVAGSKGGFFVREADGSIQAVRSYQEFPLVEDAPTRSRLRPWAWTILGLIALPGLFYVARPVQTGLPESLTVRNEAGQLHIGWNPAAVGKNAGLEILEGARETTIPIPAPLATATYLPHTGDADIRVFILDDNARPSRETALFLGYKPAPSPEAGSIRAEIENLDAEAAELQSAIARNRRRVVELKKTLDKMWGER